MKTVCNTCEKFSYVFNGKTQSLLFVNGDNAHNVSRRESMISLLRWFSGALCWSSIVLKMVEVQGLFIEKYWDEKPGKISLSREGDHVLLHVSGDLCQTENRILSRCVTC